ncbi:MAG: DNA adenine methylase [Endomicrobium sp.]|nr:DNA adenine methylase [Endomicrobium sp.]
MEKVNSKRSPLFYVGDKYHLSCSYKKDTVPFEMKREFKKTYYARFNKQGYEKLRIYVNNFGNNNPLVLYILLIYGFNRMLRFNGRGKFNLPVGNIDFNKNVAHSLNEYFDFAQDKCMLFSCEDFRDFFYSRKYLKNDFVYLDRPYLIAASEYNKLWNERSEEDLLRILDGLNEQGVRFALSNIAYYKGNKNNILLN